MVFNMISISRMSTRRRKEKPTTWAGSQKVTDNLRPEANNDDRHIVPNEDSMPHTIGRYCDCDPRYDITDYGKLIIVHNSYDARELLEIPETRDN